MYQLVQQKIFKLLKRYANKYDDFVVVTNINNISYSNYIVNTTIIFSKFYFENLFTNRVTYSGVQGVYMPNVFQMFLKFCGKSKCTLKFN